MDVRYKPEEWQDMKEGIDKITKEAIPKLKEMNRTLEDIEAKIRELDSDRSINFSHTNQEKKLHDLLDDYIELGNYCTKVGEVVSRHFDKPFLEDMDTFAGKIRDLSIKNYTTDNRIGATTTTTTPSAHGYGQVQTITTKKDEITVDDIFKESVAFEKVLKAQYKEIKKQNPDAELSYEQYRDFVPSMRGFEYETIAEEQKKLESWRDLAIAGALIILTIAVPPVGIAASVAYGGLQLKSAIEGKDWGTGRELTAAERAENGVFGVIDAIPVIGVAGKAFRATESLVTLNKLTKIKDVHGVKFAADKVSNVVQLLQNNKNIWLRDLQLKGLKAVDKINDWDHAIKGGIAKVIDGTTGGFHIAKDRLLGQSLVPADGAMQLRRGTDLEGAVKASHAESKADIQSRISKLEQEGSVGSKGTGETVKKIGDINDPIRTYRGADLGKLEAKYTADPRLTVEMPYVGKGQKNTNAEGWLRDKDFYWKEMLEKYPEAFNRSNRQKIELGFSPINNPTFRKHFPQYDLKELYNDTLIHHHIGGGGQAVAVPSKLHPGLGGIHNAEKSAGVWGNDQKYAELLEKFLEK